MKTLLPASVNGRFKDVIPPASSSWPWAFPVIYALNIAKECGTKLSWASAKPDGSVSIKSEKVNDQAIIEQIGFWKGNFGLVNSSHFQSVKIAMEAADSLFKIGLVKFIMEQGEIIRENEELSTNGTWPETWVIDSIQKIGIFCAYLYDLSHSDNLETANKFKDSLVVAGPWSEQLIVYLNSLNFAAENMSFPPTVRSQVNKVILQIQTWLKG
jgi:hypothetical protein